MSQINNTFLVIVLLVSSHTFIAPVVADTFGSVADQFTIYFVTIYHPFNSSYFILFRQSHYFTFIASASTKSRSR